MQGIDVKFMPPHMRCMAFKDNGGAVEQVWLPKIQP